MIVVVRPGMLSSVQDLGRYGHRQFGICPGGALDALALTLANRLVGNDDNAAGLELTMGRCEFRFETHTRIALAGDDFGATLDGFPLWPNWSVPVSAGQNLVLAGANAKSAKQGLRSWLAVAGGIDVVQILGSRSTDLKAGFGGHQGRALKKGDRLPIGVSTLTQALLRRRAFGLRAPGWGIDGHHVSANAPIPLRVMPGPEFDQFTVASRELLWSATWRVTPQSNRMGSRLDGPELRRKRNVDMLSAGVIPGTVQVPPSGKPIILMGDSQTTGGYPRVGVVIRADLWKLAQAPLNGRLQMVRVDATEALAAWDGQQRYLAQVDQGLASAGWPVSSQNAVVEPLPREVIEGTSHAD
ncbi:biotin-dependent carboxyltransferase family protein [Variovorax sp. PAMC28562]|uniref:5-oxoprolinase subunit C family protein n=1 Tax=Variovorax sp. PAMC28562 TaxID=2762323 RepID=UPI00164E6C99|nr:biotin-dependent carboxyltransferase family protein [Variovorax sp. PAMC28562]QNK73943.1 biotin-dependent carboxyltransferase family protein [Variovorax sp. PAMC28562]